eukprot:3642385-Pleurochrysis_carterae.AAC.1
MGKGRPNGERSFRWGKVAQTLVLTLAFRRSLALALSAERASSTTRSDIFLDPPPGESCRRTCRHAQRNKQHRSAQSRTRAGPWVAWPGTPW